jgi:hypothetical protein
MLIHYPTVSEIVEKIIESLWDRTVVVMVYA